jgi:hypothetical protein
MSEATTEFIAVARRYCKWVTSDYSPDRKTAWEALELITELHLCGKKLAGEFQCECPIPPFFASFPDDDYEDYCFEHRRGKLPFNYYSEMFYPLSIPPEAPVKGGLEDDIGDIYLDIMSGIRLFDRGYKDHAVQKWVISMQKHWGEHATAAIMALDCYLSLEDGGGGYRHTACARDLRN